MALWDSFRLYDKTVRDFAASFAVSGHPVATLFSTPDRPFAEVVQELGESDEAFRSQMMETNLIVSVSRVGVEYNPRLRVDIPFGQILRHPINADGDLLASKYPRPYILTYQLDMRSRSRTDANLWHQWIHFPFNPYHVFKINFGPLWGTHKIHCILRASRDNSELEKGEEERWIRWTVQLELMNAWMFPMTDTLDDIPDPFGMFSIWKRVEKAVIEIYTCPGKPAVPDPTIPGVELVDTVTRAEIKSFANVPVESN